MEPFSFYREPFSHMDVNRERVLAGSSKYLDRTGISLKKKVLTILLIIFAIVLIFKNTWGQSRFHWEGNSSALLVRSGKGSVQGESLDYKKMFMDIRSAGTCTSCLLLLEEEIVISGNPDL